MAPQSLLVPLSSDEDLVQVRSETLVLAAFFLLIAGGVSSWLLLPAERLYPYHLLIAFSLFALGVTLLLLRERHLAVARVGLLIGPVLVYALALIHIDAQLAYFGVLIVILNAAVNPYAGFGAALLASLPLALLGIPREVLIPALLLLWLTAIVEWVSSRGLYTALGWVSSAQQRADQLVYQLRQNQGELNRTIAALTEATRRLQRTGHELAVARLNSDRLRDLKSRFAANISHELRTPLNLILGFSETMHLTPDVYGPLEWPAALRQDVRRIYQSSKQLADLIDDVLDLSRIDGGEMPVRRDAADLGAIIHDALGLIRDLLRGRDLVLQAHLPPGLPTLSVDRARIRQVLVNLLNNAARFTQRGSITVSATLEDSQVVVSVSDTGIGIPPEEIDRVFDEYHQVDLSLRTAKDGAGLGLAISKRFVELHGGRIWVESQVAKGSTFFFSLPLDASATFTQLVRTRASSPAQPSENCVVLIDDDPDLASLLERYLSEYRVLQASGMPEAQSLLMDVLPAAMILNPLPEPAQQQTLAAQALQVASPTTPVILLSIPSRNWTARISGADRCLVKPIQRDELIALMAGYDDATKLMIVDDDAGFVQLMVRYLQSAEREYKVRWAYGAERALDLMREAPPDLVLLDLMMPGMGGLELLKAMQADAALADISVVLVTATDYAHAAFDDRPQSLQILRAAGFGALETMRYLSAILQVSRSEGLGIAAPAPQSGAGG